MRFYLGTAEVSWLSELDIPLMVSRNRLKRRATFPRAKAVWMLDSGAFTELSLRGAWTVAPRAYARSATRYAAEIGNLAYAAIQDWMCEPVILQKTGLSVHDHQARTVQSYLDLMELAPDMPWLPVLQGWTPDDYMRHVDQYHHAGVDLAVLPLVGVGSICRRQSTKDALAILGRLASEGLRLHAFGLKTEGLKQGAGAYLASSDSMAWSMQARYESALPGCSHASCISCQRYALAWRGRLASWLTE